MSAATIPIPTAEATPAATEPTPATSTTSTTPIPSVPAETTTSTTPVPAVIPAPANGASTNPLSGLSPTELKRKLEGSRKDLRTALDKKKRVDKELVAFPFLLPASFPLDYRELNPISKTI